LQEKTSNGIAKLKDKSLWITCPVDENPVDNVDKPVNNPPDNFCGFWISCW
jgi:hypothetical protein